MTPDECAMSGFTGAVCASCGGAAFVLCARALRMPLLGWILDKKQAPTSWPGGRRCGASRHGGHLAKDREKRMHDQLAMHTPGPTHMLRVTVLSHNGPA